MSDPTISEDIRSTTSSPASAAGPKPSASPDGPTPVPSGQRAVPANLSPRQAAELGLLTSGTYGPRSSTSSASADLTSYLGSRLRAEMASRGSTLFRLTWRVKATPAGRSYCQLVASVPRTSDSASGSWPTPTAALADKGVRSTEGGIREALRSHGPDLAAMAALTGWPTPLTNDTKGVAYTYDHGNPEKKCLRLLGAARLAAWVTPTARDEKGFPVKIRVRAKGVMLPEQARLASWATTPVSTELGNTLQNYLAMKANMRSGPRKAITHPSLQAQLVLPLDSGATPTGSPASTGSGAPGTFPLATRVSARVGKLRAYGNAIVPPLAAEVIRVGAEYLEGRR